MIRKITTATVVVLVACTLSTTWAGRPNKFKDWFGQFGVGYSSPTSDIGDQVDGGFYIDGGVMFWPDSSPVGLQLDLSYSSYDMKSSLISQINDAFFMDGQGRPITGGDLDVWGLAANAVWTPNKEASTQFYISGGIGVYYNKAKINTTGLIFYPPVCGWYWCLPGGVAPGTVVADSQSETEFGYNVAIGVDFSVGANDSQLYIEARYLGIETDVVDAAFLPVTIGYRW